LAMIQDLPAFYNIKQDPQCCHLESYLQWECSLVGPDCKN